MSSNSTYELSLGRIVQSGVGGSNAEGDNTEGNRGVGNTGASRVGNVEGGDIEGGGGGGNIEGDKGEGSICRGGTEGGRGGDDMGRGNAEGDRGGDAEGGEEENSICRGDIEGGRGEGSSGISFSLLVRSSEVRWSGLRASKIHTHTGKYCNLALILLPFAKSYAASSFAIAEALAIIEVGAVELTMNKCSLLMVLEEYFLYRSF